MRSLVFGGIVILALGAFVLLRGGTFSSRHDELRVGDMKITTDSHQTIPTWLGGAAIVAGAVLIVAGMRKRA